MKKLWQKHRDNIVAVCAIIGTGVAIAGLGLKLAELQEKPRQEVSVQAEAQLR